MEQCTKVKKAKKPNFTDKENEVLLEEVGLQYAILVSQLHNAVTVKRKREIWQQIAARVNSVGGNNRDWEACKKRWKDLKAAYLNKPKYNAGTGGGKTAPPVPYEDCIIQIVGQSNLTHGIEGGGDTYTLTFQNQTAVDYISGGEVPDSKMFTVHNFTVPVDVTQDPQVVTLLPDGVSAVCETAPVPVSTPSTSSATSSRSQTPQAISTGPKRKAQRSVARRRMHIQGEHDDESEAELTKLWLKSEIEKNKATTEHSRLLKEVAALKKEKLHLEIEMLRKQTESNNDESN